MYWFSSLLFLLFVLSASLLSGCPSARSSPNILLIVIDTLRADRLGSYGSRRGLTPFLDELAKKGVVFRNAYATSSWTPPSVASLFTSRFPSQHRVFGGGSRLADSETTLAERLKGAGYATAGFSANLSMTIELGVAQGFDHWSRFAEGPIKPRGRQLRNEGVRWVDATCVEQPSVPCFLYLQYMEPHAPYQAPEPYRGRFAPADADEHEVAAANKKVVRLQLSDLSDHEAELLEAAYDAEVAALDAELRLLFDELEQRRFLEDAIVVITADHGEEFRDHGSFSHGRSLYNELVRVPLILLSRNVSGLQMVEATVSLIDVAPMILELADLADQPSFEGRSLVPLLQGGSILARASGWLTGDGSGPANAPAFLELHKPGIWKDRRRHTVGIVKGRMKLLVNRRTKKAEVYDLFADPQELAPRASTDPAARDLAAVLRGLQSSMENFHPADPEQAPMDETTKEKLRALGYFP